MTSVRAYDPFGRPSRTRDPQARPPSKQLQELTRVKAALDGVDKCDARSQWACATGFRGYSEGSGLKSKTLKIPVAVEIDEQATADDRRKIGKLVVPRRAYKNCSGGDTFWTGLVSEGDFVKLAGLKRLLGWRVGVPDIPPRFDGQRDDARFDRIPLAQDVGVEDSVREEAGEVTIGIIDHGIAIANRVFRTSDGAATRITHLWDQDPQRSQPKHSCWQAVLDLGYGGEVMQRTLNALIRRYDTDERGMYEYLGYRLPLASVCHGTHVLSLAAGWPNPLDPGGTDAASRAPIVAVQLPYRPAKDTSGSALCVNVLDALHYIVQRAQKGHRVVINLSDGAHGGPHDGNSLLERAIDDFLGKHPHVTLVLAAGNAHEDRGHACASLAKTESTEFSWRVLPDDSTDSFLEVWLDRKCPPRSIKCTVTVPGTDKPIEVYLGDARVLIPTSGGVVGAVFSRLTCPDGSERSMYLIAIAPTRWRDQLRAPAPHGVWRVGVLNVGIEDEVHVDAWIERDNPVFDENAPRRQSYFEDDRFEPRQVDGQGTLGSLCGSELAIVVGGHYRRGTAFSGSNPTPSTLTPIARYSSRGPLRQGTVCGPDLVACSDESPVSDGVLGAANRSGAMFRMNGTSVAAPIVTRRIVNLLQATPLADRAAIMKTLGPQVKPDEKATGERIFLVD